MPAGAMIWFEIWVEDLERASDFYSALFGWSFEPFTDYDPDNYWLIKKESIQGTGGALVRRTPESVPADGRSTINYVWVDDLEQAVDTAVSKGGSLEEHAKAIGTVDGMFSVIVDPDGNRVGLWSP